jgi:predicted transcriptional regulator
MEDTKEEVVTIPKHEYQRLKSLEKNLNSVLEIDLGDSFGLSERDKVILDFIHKHPGLSKQKLVEALDGIYSRGPIFKSLKNLEKYGMITIHKDKPNSPIHYLYPNEKNIILNELSKLEEFENAFIQLLNRVKEENVKCFLKFIEDSKPIEMKFNGIIGDIDAKKLRSDKEIANEVKNVLTIDFKEILQPLMQRRLLFVLLVRFFKEFIQTYSTRFIYIWVNEIKDQKILKQLILMVFHKISEIQFKMSNIILEMSNYQVNYAKQNKSGFYDFGRFANDEIIDIIKKDLKTLLAQEKFLDTYFKSYNIENEFIPVKQSINKIIRDLKIDRKSNL